MFVIFNGKKISGENGELWLLRWPEFLISRLTVVCSKSDD
jgi:hypothetical protein